MILFDIFRFGHGIFFVSLQTALMFGFFMEWIRDRKAAIPEADFYIQQESKEKVSVIIPIHNESARMEGLLRTLLVQSYNAQIIFVDDRSTDESPQMLAQFVLDAKARGIDCCIITLKENPGPNRKQFALSRGITEANGDFLLFTDGDCEVPPDWIRAMVNRIAEHEAMFPSNKKTGAVIGPVFKKKQGKGFFFLYQCYDHVIRYNYLAGAIGLGAAGGGFGNNLIISRKALDSIGGYDAIPPSPTEDAALVSQLRSIGGTRIRAIAHPDAAVETEAEKTWRSFMNQTLRWNNGGLFSPEPLTRFNYNLLMLVISAGILAIPLLPFFPELWPMPLGVFIVMIENTIAAFALFRKKLPQGGILIKSGYFLTLLFTPVYFTLMTLMGYAGIKTTWKNKEIKN
ncbi:MAG: glycosyltransferase [Treponema sp.]|nr:glycosyltransferase [Treponema sp.]